MTNKNVPVITDEELNSARYWAKRQGEYAEVQIPHYLMLIAEIERLRKEVAEDDEIIDDLRCAGAEQQTEIKRLWAQFGLIKDMLALAHEQEELKGEAKNVKGALLIAAKEYLSYPKSTSGGVELTDDVIKQLVDEAEAGYDPAKLKPRPPKL